MLELDFINVGNGDAALIREMEGDCQKFAMLVDCGHDELNPPSPESQRIYAADFLRQAGVTRLDMVLLTHFHRDHIGGLGRVLETVSVGELLTTYLPPEDLLDTDLQPDDETTDLPRPARNLLRCLNIYLAALRTPGARIDKKTVLAGDRTLSYQLTDQLTMEVGFGEKCLYPRQREIFDNTIAGERNRYDLMHWGKCMNVTSLRMRLHYHGEDIVLGGDAYAVLWDNDSTEPCKILKVPHHACISSVTRKYLRYLQPETAVVSVASDRKDERPHPYIVSLLREYAKNVYFTDAVNLPGLVEPDYHNSVRLTVE